MPAKGCKYLEENDFNELKRLWVIYTNNKDKANSDAFFLKVYELEEKYQDRKFKMLPVESDFSDGYIQEHPETDPFMEFHSIDRPEKPTPGSAAPPDPSQFKEMAAEPQMSQEVSTQLIEAVRNKNYEFINNLQSKDYPKFKTDVANVINLVINDEPIPIEGIKALMNKKGPNGENPLCGIAAFKLLIVSNQLDSFKALFELDGHTKESLTHPLLLHACKNGNYEFTKYLCEYAKQHPNVNEKIKPFDMFKEACLRGNMEATKALCQSYKEQIQQELAKPPFKLSQEYYIAQLQKLGDKNSHGAENIFNEIYRQLEIQAAIEREKEATISSGAESGVSPIAKIDVPLPTFQHRIDAASEGLGVDATWYTFDEIQSVCRLFASQDGVLANSLQHDKITKDGNDISSTIYDTNREIKTSVKVSAQSSDTFTFYKHPQEDDVYALPIRQGGNHFTLIMVNTHTNEIQYIDSSGSNGQLPSRDERNVKSALAELYHQTGKPKPENFTIPKSIGEKEKAHVGQNAIRNRGQDCGAWTMMGVKALFETRLKDGKFDTQGIIDKLKVKENTSSVGIRTHLDSETRRIHGEVQGKVNEHLQGATLNSLSYPSLTDPTAKKALDNLMNNDAFFLDTVAHLNNKGLSTKGTDYQKQLFIQDTLNNKIRTHKSLKEIKSITTNSFLTKTLGEKLESKMRIKVKKDGKQTFSTLPELFAKQEFKNLCNRDENKDLDTQINEIVAKYINDTSMHFSDQEFAKRLITAQARKNLSPQVTEEQQATADAAAGARTPNPTSGTQPRTPNSTSGTRPRTPNPTSGTQPRTSNANSEARAESSDPELIVQPRSSTQKTPNNNSTQGGATDEFSPPTPPPVTPQRQNATDKAQVVSAARTSFKHLDKWSCNENGQKTTFSKEGKGKSIDIQHLDSGSFKMTGKGEGVGKNIGKMAAKMIESMPNKNFKFTLNVASEDKAIDFITQLAKGGFDIEKLNIRVQGNEGNPKKYQDFVANLPQAKQQLLTEKLESLRSPQADSPTPSRASNP